MSAEPDPAARGPRTFGLPLRARREAWGATLGVLAVYVATMSRDLAFYDSAELAMVAVQGGLGHPIGQPLHTLLGWLLTSALPGSGMVLWVLNLLSAVPTALMVLPLVSLAERLAPAAPRWIAPVVVGALLLHPVFWENGSRVEVYALAGLLAVWAAARMADALERGRGWLGAGLALGLCAATNPYTAIIAALSAGPALLWALLRRRWTLVGVALAVLGGLTGLLVYVYVPLVAGRDGVFVWGQPIDAEALRFYFSGADFGHNRGATGGMVLGHAWWWVRVATAEGLVPVALVGAAAQLALGRTLGIGRAYGLIGLTLTVLLLASNAIFHPAIPDYAGYLAPPVGVLVAGVAGLVAHMASRGGRSAVLAGALAAVTVAAAWIAAPPVWARTRHDDRLARALAEGVLDTAPPDAVVVVDSDHWVWPLFYLQAVEGRRPDVVVLAFGLADSSWYWGWLYRLHGDLEPFALRGPGGRLDRVRRFLAANVGRPPLYENLGLGGLLGRPGCMGPWLLADARACPVGDAERDAEAVLSPLTETLASGSPASDAVLARVTVDRAMSAWHLGQARLALAALRAGIPDALEPPAPEVVDLPGPAAWLQLAIRDAPPIGHVSENLALVSEILRRRGQHEAARAWADAAARAWSDSGAGERLITE